MTIVSAAPLAAIFSSPASAALRAFDQRQTAVQVHAVRSSISAGMAVYVAYAGVQVSALGGTAPAYDIYDSENYPRVSLTPQTTPSLPLAHHRSSPIATCFCLSLCIESFGPHGCLLFTQHQRLQRGINLQDEQRLCGLRLRLQPCIAHLLCDLWESVPSVRVCAVVGEWTLRSTGNVCL